METNHTDILEAVKIETASHQRTHNNVKKPCNCNLCKTYAAYLKDNP